jgi:micrococcal nuclease
LRKKAISLYLFLFFTISASWTFAETFSGRCVGIGDGDTMFVMKNGKAVKVRLEGIDCPELGQDFGTRAKQFTSSMVFRKTIVVKECSKDIYGREIVRIYVEGLDLSLELVKAGLAWYFNAFTSDPALAAAEKAARKQKIGLWSMPNPIPPWVYRRQHRREGQGSI